MFRLRRSWWLVSGVSLAALMLASAGSAGHAGSDASVFHLGVTNASTAVTFLGSSSSSPLAVQSTAMGGTAVTGAAHVGNGWGVYGQTTSSATSARGVVGTLGATVPGSASAGVLGRSSSTTHLGPGVWGEHELSSGTAPGVLGTTDSTSASAVGVLGEVTSTTPGPASAGVKGVNNGTGADGVGILALHQGSGMGLFAVSAFGPGVHGSHSGPGASGTDPGVFGRTISTSDLAAGVKGEAPNGSLSAGVYGSSAGFGVLGIGAAAGVLGYNPPGLAGYFVGNAHVTGTLTKGGGAFRIDHPLEPETKYLQHSFVESPDMKNVYDGVVTTDRRGFATVRLPRYFSALNRDFRYQLTIVGSRGWRARVVKEIAGNRFTVESDEPRVKVSWQVTGIRKDAYANAHRIDTEVHKPAAEQGRYLNPELYGKPASAGTRIAAALRRR